MMDVILVCNDTFALDVKMIIEAYNSAALHQRVYNIVGYLTIYGKALDFMESLAINWLGTVDDYEEQICKNVVVAIRNPIEKRKAVNILRRKKAKFISLIAPWTAAPAGYPIGEGSILAAQSIQGGTKIGKFVFLYQTLSDANAVIEDYATILGYSNITAAHIGEEVFIGSNCVVLERVTIGKGAVIYPGSLVMKNVDSNSSVMGVPARPLRSFCNRNNIIGYEEKNVYKLNL